MSIRLFARACTSSVRLSWRIRVNDLNKCNNLHCSSIWLKGTEGEQKLTRILTEKLNPTFIEVVDISGGCGSMYEINIESDIFKGVRTIQQHRMVNDALGDVVKSLHGLTLKTSSPTS